MVLNSGIHERAIRRPAGQEFSSRLCHDDVHRPAGDAVADEQEHAGLMSETLATVLLAGGAAALLALIAAGLLTVEASRRDFAQRVQQAVRSNVTAPTNTTAGSLMLGKLQRFGQRLRDSAMFSAPLPRP
jgi:hypothetical protein